MSFKHLGWVAVAVLAAGLVSCARKPPQADPLEPVMRESVNKMSQGLTNEALAVIESAFVQKRLRAQKPRLLHEIVRFHLRLDAPQAAQIRILAALREDPALASAVLGPVENYLFERQRYAEVTAWCRQVAELVPDEGVQSQLAGWDVRARVAGGHLEEAFAALKAALARFPPPLALRLLGSTYTDILGKGAPADMKALLALAGTLEPKVTTDAEKAHLAGIMLDASFCAQEFKTALRILEAGVPGTEEEWSVLMLSKVRAHIAQQEGRLEDAVVQYRAFMARIEAGQKDQVDPVGGGRVTWEMILGLNARRIAELLTQAGKPGEAATALAEARGYYEKALARLKPNSAEYTQVQATLKELGAAP